MSDTLVLSTFYEELEILILGDHVIFCLHCACVTDASTKNGMFQPLLYSASFIQSTSHHKEISTVRFTNWLLITSTQYRYRYSLIP